MSRPAAARRLAAPAVLVALAAAVGCQSNGHFCLLGYTTEPNYDPDIRTVYVPIFRNVAFQTTPYRGMEADITRAVVREIGAKTPFRVVSDPEKADTELLGTLVGIDKQVVSRNQQNLPRESLIVLTVELVWRDLRDGRVLSNRDAPVADPLFPAPFDPNAPVQPPNPAALPKPINPVKVVATGRMIQELGESNASAEKLAVDRLAVQIVSLMERQW